MLAMHLAARLAIAGLPAQPGALPAPEVAGTLPFAPAPAVSIAPPALSSALAEPEPAAAPAPPAVATTTATPPAAVPDRPVAVPGRVPGDADPFEPINRISYAVTQPIDRFILRPAAIAYSKVVPRPLRDGARNFIQLLSEPECIFNDLLQLRPVRALKGVARFVLNGTLGIGGLFDVAKRKPFHITHHDNGFGDTLGYYGVGPLAYFYLPVLGPTTIRDFAGSYVDDLSQPRLLYLITHPDSDKPIFRTRVKLGKVGTIVQVVSGLDQRAENDQELEAIRTDSVDPYAAMRTSYLQDRAGNIAMLKAKDGAEAVNPQLDDPLADPAAPR